ncbi:hypothetical protein TSUD_347100 [Trifolium subterraneum]|nr:hypothetical protein TSUD_347100 [Trifolium subterraneum]
MEFCPMCGSMLMLQLQSPGTRFYCKTCPYVCPIERGVKIKRKQFLVRKGIETILSFDDMKNAPTSEVPCPNCRHGKAAYKEVQTRSADEPATIFYACLNEN